MSGSPPPKILLVDDIKLFLELERVFLRRMVCDILTASTGEDALVILRNERPALVVLDDQMPGIGGIETCRRIKADPAMRSTVVLMASNAGLESGCFEAGADAFIAKPIVQKGFIEKVRSLLPSLAERANERAFVGLPVEAHLGDRTIQAESRDLSTTGMFLKTTAVVSLGQPVRLRFRLSPSGQVIEVEGEVRNRVLSDGDTRMSPGFGVCFDSLGAEGRQMIEEYVRRLEGTADSQG